MTLNTRTLRTAAALLLCAALLVSRRDAANADNIPAAEPFTPENVGATSNPDNSGGGGNPSPSPTPPCPTYVVATLDMLGISPTGSVSNPIQLKTDNAKNMQCLTTIISGIMTNSLVRAYRGSGYWDDAVIGKFDEIFFPQTINYHIGVTGDPNKKQILTQVSAAGSVCWENMWLHPTGYRSCSKGIVAIKEGTDKHGNPQCQVAPLQDVVDDCGPDRLTAVDMAVTFLRSSPLSLLWTDEADVEQEVSIVDFPLNPQFKNAWYSWKASAKAPLVVWDPSHTGKISSGSQLLGPWAFGGKKTASLESSSVVGSAWKDGYEALGSLDQNGDGVVSGSELDSLALWFDNNQDAISQPGEVLTLAQAGVTELFYRDTKREAITGNIHAAKGFIRVTDGKSAFGRSVDWFADSAATPGELNAKYIMQHFAQTNSGPEIAPEVPSAPSQYGAQLPHDTLVGAWNWNYEAIGGPEGQSLSYLLFGVSEKDQRLFGYSVFGTPFTKESRHGLQGLVNASMFTGTFAAGNQGTRTLNWGIDSGDSHLKTEAVLSADGTHLSGTTTAYLSTKGSFKKVSYRWNASKVQ